MAAKNQYPEETVNIRKEIIMKRGVGAAVKKSSIAREEISRKGFSVHLSRLTKQLIPQKQ